MSECVKKIKKEEKHMVTNKMSNLTKSRKFYLFLCCVTVFSLFLEIRIANSAPPTGIAVETFTAIDFVENLQCFKVQMSGTSIQYINGCPIATVNVVVTRPDGTQATFLIGNKGQLVFLGGSLNVVHIIKEQE